VNHLFGKITISASVFLLIFISFSCISTKPLYIEIPQKSKKELPENIQSLLLVARVVDDRYTNLETDSLQKIFYHQQFDYDTIINDIQSVDTTLKALGELLFESGRYDFVIPENRFLEFEKNAFITKEMQWDEVKMLCDTFGTDAILSLDYFKTRVSTTYEKENYFEPGSNSFYTVAQAQMKVAYDALFRVYDPGRERIIMREFLRDTIIWEDEDSSTNLLFDRFTPVKNALTEAGIAIALDLSEEISTKWYQEKRSYFATGDSNMKQAARLLNTGNWEPAIALWKETVEKGKSKSLKSKAEFNIALGYELKGDLDAAIEWGLKSYETMYRTHTYNYLEILKRRKNDLNNR
jgi:tetratricopeptide (TPR) repeat protein